jgi:3-hydroxybutyryl-CoA dehydrogenase
MAIKTVGVIGCGIMGSGIAQVCATHGYDVMVLEVDETRLSAGLDRIKSGLARELSRGRITQEQHDGALGRLQGTLDLQDLAERDLIIEAAIEEITAKRNLFRRLGETCRPDTLLASNTSSLSISELAGVTERPERVIGLHFFNPPVVLKLVEVVPTAVTSQETIDAALAFCESIDRVIVRAKDTTGFIVNRLLVPFLLDAIRLVESGVATPADIDQACQTGLGHTMGPLATCDLVGLDTLAQICDVMFEEYGEPRFKAPTLLRRMVSLNRLGRKTGQGFYEHSR